MFDLSGKKILNYPQFAFIPLEILDFELYEVYNSVDKQMEVADYMAENFPTDFVAPLDDGVLFKEVIGVPLIKFPKDSPSSKEAIMFTVEDIKKAKKVIIEKEPRMKKNLEVIKRLKKKYPEKEIILSLEGPFTLAGELASPEKLARKLIKDREFVTELLRYTVSVIKEYAAAGVDAGATVVQILEPLGVILNNKRFGEYITPYVKEIWENLDCCRILHVCGDTTKLLNEMKATGCHGISIDQIMEIEKVLRENKDVAVIGNLDPVDSVFKRSSVELKQEIQEFLKKMSKYPNFVFSTGCDCVTKTPIENLRVLVEEVNNFKK